MIWLRFFLQNNKTWPFLNVQYVGQPERIKIANMEEKRHFLLSRKLRSGIREYNSGKRLIMTKFLFLLGSNSKNCQYQTLKKKVVSHSLVLPLVSLD
jgi:hypothetical protein